MHIAQVPRSKGKYMESDPSLQSKMKEDITSGQVSNHMPVQTTGME